MRERVGFIALVEQSELTLAEVCERYEISRKTGYKWLARYEESGPGGLVERSRRPHHSPNATPRRVAEALEELRRRHPTWGAGKLLKPQRCLWSLESNVGATAWRCGSPSPSQSRQGSQKAPPSTSPSKTTGWW